MNLAGKLAASLVLIILAGCSIHGVPREDGTIDLGPNVFGDDAVTRQDYASYAEFVVATGQDKHLQALGLTRDQRICYIQVLVDEFPKNLRIELDNFATGRMSLKESEYTDLTNRAMKIASNPDVIASANQQFRAHCISH